jgi:hypothetical protein
LAPAIVPFPFPLAFAPVCALPPPQSFAKLSNGFSEETAMNTKPFYGVSAATQRPTFRYSNFINQSPRPPILAAWILPLLLLTLPVAVEAQFTFTTNNGAITITKYTGPGGDVTIPGTTNGYPVTSVGDSAFANSASLTSIIMPDTVTNIGIFAFQYCTRLGTVSIPSGVNSIAGGAFDNCVSLTNVTMPMNLRSIDIVAFRQCYSLASVVVPDNVTNIGDSVFLSCMNLKNVMIGSNLLSIGSSAFLSCTSLTNITIPNSVSDIGNFTFGACAGLTSVTIPASVTNIGPQSAFPSCRSLRAISVDALNPSYCSLDGILFNKSQTALLQYPSGKTGSAYTIPNTVTNIAYDAFYACGALTSVVIPGSVTSIGSFAFGVSGLTNINIPASVNSLGTYAFYWCTSLTSTTIPNGVTSVPDGAFDSCFSLTNVTIPNSVTSIGVAAFYNCVSLTGIYLEGVPPSFGPYVFDGDNNATVYYLPGTTGWGTTFDGLPTALWIPHVLTSDASFGVRTNQFGFNITWASGMTVVVEACTNLVDSTWYPLQTNTLTGASSYFSDPQWTNYPARFYRLRSP